MDKKQCIIDVEVFRDILQICLRLLNQEFDATPSDEEIVTFIKELRHKSDIKSITDVVVDQLHQPWRIFASIINKCLSGKITSLDNIRLSRAQILWGGSSEGADLESEVLDEPKGKSIDTSERTSLKPRVPDMSKVDSSESKYESWGDSDDDNDNDDQQSDDERIESNDDDKTIDINKTDDEEEDEFVHTPDDYVPTDDENVDDEEFEHINKEMYSDVIVELKDSEHEGEGKDDEEINDVEHENVSQEVAGDQVKGDAQPTVAAAPTTQKTKVTLQSSSISSDHVTKFLNFDIPSGETEIISMMDIKVQHEDPSIQTSPLLTVLVTLIPKTSSAPVTTIPPPIPPFITLTQQSTPIPTPITTEATTSTTTTNDSTTLTAIHQRLSNVEMKSRHLELPEVPIIVKEYLKTSLDDALHKALQRHTAKLVNEHSVLANVTDHKALYHALIELILKDEDAIDKGVADKLKKRKPDDDRDEGPPAGPDQGLKRKKTCKEIKPLKKAKSTRTSKGTTKSQPKLTGKSAQAEKTVFEAGDTQVPHDLGEDKGNTDEPPIVNVDPKDWFKKPERPPTLDPEWNEDFSAFVMNRLQISDLTQDTLVGPAYKLLKVTYDKHALFGTSHWGPKRQRLYGYASKRISTHDGYSTKRILVVTNVRVKVWYGYGHLEEIDVRRSDQKLHTFKEGDFPRLYLNDIEDMLLLVVQNRLLNLEGDVIVHFAAALRMFIRRIVIQNRGEDIQLVVEIYISKPRTREEDLSQRSPYTTLLNP
ncbi:hypothetical protein Tco_1176009 [Tanacetum coccineum]